MDESVKDIWDSEGMPARVTFYNGLDDQYGDTTASKNPWGIAKAVEGLTVAGPKELQGKWVQFQGEEFPRYIHDTGSAVESRKASGGNELVLDIYTKSPDIKSKTNSFGDFRNFKIVDSPSPKQLEIMRQQFGVK